MTWKKMALMGIPAIALAMSAPSGAQAASIVTNGSFEVDTPPVADGKEQISSNGFQPSGWTINKTGSLTYLDAPGGADNGHYLNVYGPFPHTSPDGGNFIEADGDPSYSGTISQTLHGLTVGQLYAVTFYQAAGQQAGFQGGTTERWSVSFGSSNQLSSLFTLPEGGVGDWQLQTLYFTAHEANQVLSFLAVGTPGGAPPISFLDGVAVNAVPEPSTLVLSGVSLAGISIAMLRRRAMSKSIAV